MRSTSITAFEHEELPINGRSNGGLDPDEADRILGVSKERPGFCQLRHRSVRLSQYCGLINLGNRMLEVLPKVGFEASGARSAQGLLLRMLRDAGAVPTAPQVASGHNLQSASLLQSFIASFFDEVRLLLSGGLLRRYQVQEEDLYVIRGRIDLQRQMTQRFGRPDIVACKFDDLNVNNLINRAIKTGLRTVRPWLSDGVLERRWIELMGAVDEIDDVSVTPQQLERLVIDRQVRRYGAALTWVRLILSLLSPDLRAGRSQAPGLLFDMNVVFQQAVANRWKRFCDDDVELSSQDLGQSLATLIGSPPKTAISVRPDIVLRRNNWPVAIADTKWKRLIPKADGVLLPAAADFYQLHAYAAVYGCEQLLLVYPWHPGMIESRDCAYALPEVKGGHPQVHVVCVDLHGEGYPVVVGADAVRAALTPGVRGEVRSQAHFPGLIATSA